MPTAITGSTRFQSAPISVQLRVPGFQTIRQTEIRLSVNFIAKLDQVMKVASLSESVNVSGGSPVVDVVSTAVRTELLQETIETLPTSRDGLKVYRTKSLASVATSPRDPRVAVTPYDFA